ncbi:MAG: hypothetical protein ACJA0T_000019 [Colwellia sp.]|jgi:hypothetical protein
MLKLKRKYTRIDFLFLIVMLITSNYLYDSFFRKEIFIRAIKVSEFESPFLYWGMFSFMVVTVLTLLFFILFFNSEEGRLNK